MKKNIFILLLLCAHRLLAQHADTVHVNYGTVIVMALNDDQIIKEGDSLLDRNMVKEAIAKYTTVVEISPKNKVAISDRAFAYLQLDNYSAALEDYNLTLGLDSTDYVNLSNRALVKWYLKKYKEAIIDCDKAIKYNADYAFAYFHKGISQFKLNDYKEAIICFDRVIKMNPTFDRAFYNRGNSKFELKDLTGACGDWGKAMTLGNKNAISMVQKYCNGKASP